MTRQFLNENNESVKCNMCEHTQFNCVTIENNKIYIQCDNCGCDKTEITKEVALHQEHGIEDDLSAYDLNDIIVDENEFSIEEWNELIYELNSTCNCCGVSIDEWGNRGGICVNCD